jgi:hypothetical protein
MRFVDAEDLAPATPCGHTIFITIDGGWAYKAHE